MSRPGADSVRFSRITAVVNPAAGGDGAAAVAALESAGAVSVTLLETVCAGDGRRRAYDAATAADPPDVVVAVGGDGTVSEVVEGLYRARRDGAAAVPLLVAPAGTGNSSYRGLWDDAPWDTTVRTVVSGSAATYPIDLARISEPECVAFLGSATGLLPETLRVAERLPGKGRERLMVASLQALETMHPYPGLLRVDGATLFEGPVLETLVGGFRHRGGLLRLLPESVVDDGLLDLTVLCHGVDMGELAQAAVSGNVYDVPGVLHGRGRRVTIERTDGAPLLYEHDGEIMPEGPSGYELEVLESALSVLGPAEPLPWRRDAAVARLGDARL